MILFATDFGAGGAVVFILLSLWGVALALFAIGVFIGVKTLSAGTTRRRVLGFILIAVSCAIPMFCCFSPPHFFHAKYGTYPLNRNPRKEIENGMSTVEIEAMLGKPQIQSSEVWYYYTDSYELGWVSVHFGPDGKVTGTYQD